MKEYELAEIFQEVTLSTEEPAVEHKKHKTKDTTESGNGTFESEGMASASATSATSSIGNMEEEADNQVIREQNNETLGKKTKRGHHKVKGSASHKKQALLKTLAVPESGYSRQQRAKKNRRGRKSTQLS